MGVFGGVLSAGFPNGEDVERLDFPKNEVDGAEPKAEEAPKEGVPNEGAPNAGLPATSDLLVGVLIRSVSSVCGICMQSKVSHYDVHKDRYQRARCPPMS